MIDSECTDLTAVRPPVTTLVERIDSRLSELRRWLDEHAPAIEDDQKHLDAGSAERAYWHHGYAMALRDIRDCLPNNPQEIS